MRFVVPEEVSTTAFDRWRRQADVDRGVDPDGPERTPSAAEVRRRLGAAANRPLSWSGIVTGALGDEHEPWLRAATRETAAEVSPAQLSFGLRYVAQTLDTRSLNRDLYEAERACLVVADEQRFGDGARLRDLLPTVEQIDGQYGWTNALVLVGLAARRPKERRRAGRRAPAGLPVVEAVGFFGALNGRWPSATELAAWARDSRFALTNPAPLRDQWDAVCAQAGQLLAGAGCAVPGPYEPPRGGRGARRPGYRYPVDGIPGAPPPARLGPNRTPPEQAARVRELCVLGLRHFLSGATRDSLSAYRKWLPGTEWPGLSTINRHGGFADLREEARTANRASRAEYGVDITDAARARAQELQLLIDTAPAVEPVPFAEAVAALLAGPLAVG